MGQSSTQHAFLGASNGEADIGSHPPRGGHVNAPTPEGEEGEEGEGGKEEKEEKEEKTNTITPVAAYTPHLLRAANLQRWQPPPPLLRTPPQHLPVWF